MSPAPRLPAAEAIADHLSRDAAARAILRGPVAAATLVPLREKGVAHIHYRIAGSGFLLRIPRLSQWGMNASDALAYEAACFRRAEPSGATPRLRAVLAPGERLPRGALLVEEIAGRPPVLPDDLPRLAEALARLHGLPVPAPERRPPIADHANAGPIAATLAVIERQRPALASPGLPPATVVALYEEIGWARALAASAPPAAQPVALVGTDTHPGNFVIGETGAAILVDLEKTAYGSPAIDLAHTSLVTSTLWDRDVQAVLNRADTIGFYRHYLGCVGAAAAERLGPWLLPSRRLTWLRTMMWCAQWRLSAGDPAHPAAAIDPGLAAHIRARIDASFAPSAVAEARSEWLADPPLGL